MATFIAPGPTKSQQTQQLMIDPILNSLQSLTNMQLKNINNQKERSNIMAGLSSFTTPEQAKSLSFMPTELLKGVLPKIYAQNQANQQAQQFNQGQGGQQGEPTTEHELAQQAYNETLHQTGGNRDLAAKAGIAARDRFIKQQELKDRRLAATKKELEPIKDSLAKSTKMAPRIANSVRAAQSGTLRAGTAQQFWKKLGLGNVFRNPATELAQKELKSYSFGVKDAFGNVGRIMATEFEAFVKSNADELNTPEAIAVIGTVNLVSHNLEVERHKERMQLIRDNGGQIPFDMKEQLDDIMHDRSKEAQENLRKTYELFTDNRLPTWNNPEWNPARYKRGSAAPFPTKSGIDTPMKLVDGMWVVDFDKLKE